MTISIDTKKYDRIQHPIMIKVLSIIEMDDLVISNYEKHSAGIFDVEILNIFLFKSGTRQKYLFSPLLYSTLSIDSR